MNSSPENYHDIWNTSHIPAGLEYLNRCLIGDRSGDMDGQSSVDMTALQTVPCHTEGMGQGIVLLEDKNCFQQSDRSAGLAGKGLHPHAIGDHYITISYHTQGGLFFQTELKFLKSQLVKVLFKSLLYYKQFLPK